VWNVVKWLREQIYTKPQQGVGGTLVRPRGSFKDQPEKDRCILTRKTNREKKKSIYWSEYLALEAMGSSTPRS
jgi:hypothetical protein